MEFLTASLGLEELSSKREYEISEISLSLSLSAPVSFKQEWRKTGGRKDASQKVRRKKQEEQIKRRKLRKEKRNRKLSKRKKGVKII